MAQNLGYGNVTESSLIANVGTNNTAPEALAGALEQATGQSFSGGALNLTPSALNDSQVQGYVNALSNNGSSPFMALFENPSTIGDGHWVLVNGVDAQGNIMITDPAGLNYTQTPSGFSQAWHFGNIVKPSD